MQISNQEFRELKKLHYLNAKYLYQITNMIFLFILIINFKRKQKNINCFIGLHQIKNPFVLQVVILESSSNRNATE